MKPTVDAWLAERKEREPTIARSVEIWEERHPNASSHLGRRRPYGDPKRATPSRRPYDSTQTKGVSRVQLQVSVRAAGSRGPDRRKQSIMLDEESFNELHAESKRQDRPISWLLQQAWREARSTIKKFSPEEP